jgi:hypothetical protein
MNASVAFAAYCKAHPRAARARWDAYGLAAMYLAGGRGDFVTPKRIHALINGGACNIGHIRRGVADARRDFAAS